jgi:hypothetical protein
MLNDVPGQVEALVQESRLLLAYKEMLLRKRRALLEQRVILLEQRQGLLVRYSELKIVSYSWYL